MPIVPGAVLADLATRGMHACACEINTSCIVRPGDELQIVDTSDGRTEIRLAKDNTPIFTLRRMGTEEVSTSIEQDRIFS